MRLLSGTYHQGAQLLTMALAPFAILLVFFSKDVLLLWTGDPTVAEQAAPILRLLAAGTLLHGLMHIPYMLQLAAGWSSLSVRVNLAFAAILVPSIIVAVPHFGAIGAAAIWCLLNVGYILVSIQIMHRRLLPAERLRWYTEDTARPILVLMGAALLFSIVDPHTHHAVLSAMFLGIAGISLAILAVLSAPLARETLIRQLRSFNSAKAGTQSRTLE